MSKSDLKKLISLYRATDKLLKEAEALTLDISKGFKKEFEFRKEYFQYKFKFHKESG